jgi:hypothetical protein
LKEANSYNRGKTRNISDFEAPFFNVNHAGQTIDEKTTPNTTLFGVNTRFGVRACLALNGSR